jgi:hypothetical protein
MSSGGNKTMRTARITERENWPSYALKESDSLIVAMKNLPMNSGDGWEDKTGSSQGDLVYWMESEARDFNE